MKVLILKVGTMLSKEDNDNMHRAVIKEINTGVLILDQTCDYEVVDLSDVSYVIGGLGGGNG